MSIDTEAIALVSACTALVASIAGPTVSLVIARRQIKANLISANRQRWIESLRDQTAELIGRLSAAAAFKFEHGGQLGAAIAKDLALLDKVERIVLVRNKIRLMLNPGEADHQRLLAAMEAAFARLDSSEPLDPVGLGADIETITSTAQGILKREWMRVKHGD